MDDLILSIIAVFFVSGAAWLAMILFCREKIALMDEFVSGRRVMEDNIYFAVYRSIDYACISTFAWVAGRVHPDVDLTEAPKGLTRWFRVMFALLATTILSLAVGFTLMQFRGA